MELLLTLNTNNMKTINLKQVALSQRLDLRSTISSALRRALLDLTQSHLSSMENSQEPSALCAATEIAIDDIREMLDEAISYLTVDYDSIDDTTN